MVKKVALCAGGALVAKDVAFLIALRGALLGSLVNYAWPALVFLRSARGRGSVRGVRAAHIAMIAYGIVGSILSTCALVLY